MKKEELVKLIRKIVKEEVVNVVSDIVPTLLSEVVAEHLIDNTGSKHTIVSENKEQTLSELIGIPKRINKPKYANNPTLNDILQNTQPLSAVEAQNGMLSPAQMMAQQYESRQMDSAEWEPSVENQSTVGVPLVEQTAGLDVSTIKLLTKNASKALEKSKQISEQRQPSNINFDIPQPINSRNG